jgi:hypothetical protein
MITSVKWNSPKPPAKDCLPCRGWTWIDQHFLVKLFLPFSRSLTVQAGLPLVTSSDMTNIAEIRVAVLQINPGDLQIDRGLFAGFVEGVQEAVRFFGFGVFRLCLLLVRVSRA